MIVGLLFELNSGMYKYFKKNLTIDYISFVILMFHNQRDLVLTRFFFKF